MVGSLPEGEIPHWLKPNPINILMVDAPPYFGTDLAQRVVTRLGDTAFLRCKVFNLGNKMVIKIILRGVPKKNLTKLAPQVLLNFSGYTHAKTLGRNSFER